MCDLTVDGNNCFGGLETPQETAAAFFKYPSTTDMETETSRRAGTAAFNTNARAAVDSQTNNLGIPLGIMTRLDSTNIGYVQNAKNMVVWGGYQGDSGDGKATTGRDGVKYNTVTQTNEARSDTVDDLYLFWAIQDQTKTWWEYDHVDLQNRYQSEGDEPADIQQTEIQNVNGWDVNNGLI